MSDNTWYAKIMELIPDLKLSYTSPSIEDLRSHAEKYRSKGLYKATVRECYASVTLAIGKESYSSKFYGPIEYVCSESRLDKPVKKRAERDEDLLVNFIYCWRSDARILDDEGIKDAVDLMACEWLVGTDKSPQDVRKLYVAFRDAEDGWNRLGMRKYESKLDEILEDY